MRIATFVLLLLVECSFTFAQTPKTYWIPPAKSRTTVKVLVSADGTVNNAQIIASCGMPVCDDAALAAVRKWRFDAGSEGKVNAETWKIVDVVLSVQERSSKP